MTLPKRIKWLRGPKGPSGALSHDSFAAILGTKRQVLIGWEKGAEPNEASRAKLAEFSGFPAEAFSRRLAEPLAEEMLGRRLEGLATKLGDSIEKQTKMDAEIRLLRSRVNKLEAPREVSPAAPKRPRKSGP